MNRCCKCSKKLNILFTSINTCRCKNIYCAQHMMSHECSYDYKTVERKFLEEKLVKVVSDKVVHI